MQLPLVFRLEIILYLAFLIGNFGFAQLIIEQDLEKASRLTNDNLEFSFCDDDDNDGFMTFDVVSLEERVIEFVGLENEYYLEQILLSTSFGILAVNNPSNNPSITVICNDFTYPTFDIAVDSYQNIYTTGLSRIYDDCSRYNYSVSSWGVNALSFDDLDNLYTGFGNESYVLKRTGVPSGGITSSTIWHDFEEGTSGGDFVSYNGKMYVAWRLGSYNYRLYEVTVDAERNYVSHIDLGELPNKTYGLAKELNKLYGVTPDKLYQINLEDFSFMDVMVNPNPEEEWFGAAGLHEALNFNTTLHLTNEDAEADSNRLNGEWTNAVEGEQVIYARIENLLTGTFDIVNVIININKYPNVNLPITLEKCYIQDYNIFDLGEQSDQMIRDSNQNLEFIYFNSNNVSIILSQFHQSSAVNESLSVKVVNLDGGCSEIYDFRIVNNRVPQLLPLSSTQSPTELSMCYIDRDNMGYFDLTDIESKIILEGSEFNTAFYSSFEDAEAEINEISNIYYLQAPSEEIFIRVTDEKGCYSISNFYLNLNCIKNNVSTDFIIFPRFITPNNDSKNDYWNVKGVSEKLREVSTITIFNRYGKSLYSFNSSSIEGWDGTVNGRLMPTDDYWVVFQTNSGFTKTGHFTLKR